MTERNHYSPEEISPDPDRTLSQAALEALYLIGNPAGIAALPENAEYDIREIPTPQALTEIDEP